MKNLSLKDINLISIFLCILIISSKFVIPISFIPFTLQTFSVFIISLILKSKKAFITFLVYIFIGLLGLPVFSKGGGINYILEPSFGFIIGFLLSSLIIGFVKETNNKLINLLLVFIGLIIIYSLGSIYMFLLLTYIFKTNPSISYIISIAITPFIIKDIISIFISILIFYRINHFLYIEENISYTLN